MAYIDGFVIAAPATRRQEVVDYAARFDPLFLEVGATRVVEAWGDDVPHGKLTDFHRAVAASGVEFWEHQGQASLDFFGKTLRCTPAR